MNFVPFIPPTDVSVWLHFHLNFCIDFLSQNFLSKKSLFGTRFTSNLINFRDVLLNNLSLNLNSSLISLSWTLTKTKQKENSPSYRFHFHFVCGIAECNIHECIHSTMLLLNMIECNLKADSAFLSFQVICAKLSERYS